MPPHHREQASKLTHYRRPFLLAGPRCGVASERFGEIRSECLSSGQERKAADFRYDGGT